jgi:hypothetical protein
MDGWKNRETDRCMDESIDTQNEEHGDAYLWAWLKRWTEKNQLTERDKWMDAWLDRQKDGEFNS